MRSGWEDAGGQVPVAPVADDERDGGVLHLGRDLLRHPASAGGRDAGEDAFFARQPAAHLFRVALAHEHQLVHAGGIVDLRQVFLRPLADAGDARALAGLRADDAHGGVLFFQVARDAGDGAGGAHGAHEVRDAPAGLLPQLGAGGLVVDARVVGVGELVQHAALAFFLHLVGQVARVFHAAALGREDQLGAESLHGLGTFDRQVLRHDQHHAVALDGGGHGQGDAGVARGGFDQRVAGLDLTALLGALDHRERRAVFHRTGRVVAFELAQHHIAPGLVVGGADALQRHQRCVANGAFDRRIVHERHCAIISFPHIPARVVKLVDAGDSKSPAARRAGSIPAPGTTDKAAQFQRRAAFFFFPHVLCVDT
eukprot:Opistho-1_new@93269